MALGSHTSSDYRLAILLQAEFTAENNAKNTEKAIPNNNVVDRPLSIVDDSWELIDPVPDIRELFLQFNDAYFNGLLAGVEVKWSPRMTLCAGLCSYEGRGGLCSIRLSQPLLKLRPRRDLVQTLLHEMIHAVLFVTQNNKDHDAHGPEFHKHMHRINQKTGTKITVFHSFHYEVNEYRQHWWQCDGPCRSRRPFFGIVRRAMNRAPSRHDTWWGEHQRSCGGTFNKIKEPENYKKKRTRNKTETENDPPGKKSMAFPGKGQKLGGNGASLHRWFVKSPSKESSPGLNQLPRIPTTPGTSSRSKPPDREPPKTNISTVNVDCPFNIRVNGPGPSQSTNGDRVLLSGRDRDKALVNVVAIDGECRTANNLGAIGSNTKDSPSHFSGVGNTVGYKAVDDATYRSIHHLRKHDDIDFKVTVVRPKPRSPVPTNNTRPVTNVIDLVTNEPGHVSNDETESNSHVNCPVCNARLLQKDINNHLDNCLGNNSIAIQIS